MLDWWQWILVTVILLKKYFEDGHDDADGGSDKADSGSFTWYAQLM